MPREYLHKSEARRTNITAIKREREKERIDLTNLPLLKKG